MPVRRVDGHLVTTVFDLLLAQYGVARDGLPGVWPTGYDDADEPYTPAWQEAITGVPAPGGRARSVASSPPTPRSPHGRSMIIMGAGTNHWFHSDTIYRAFLTLTTLTGCQGVNGGGWAHYVGQEKVRPITGYTAAGERASDWARPPRKMIQTAYWYLHTDQFRYDPFGADTLASATAGGSARRQDDRRRHRAVGAAGLDAVLPDVRPQPAGPGRRGRGRGPAGRRVRRRRAEAGRLRFAGEDPDTPENFPRVLTIWRANLLGLVRQGQRVLPQAPARHRLLGAGHRDAPEGLRPRDVVWREEAPEGKLDLLLTLDFRMTSTTIFSDVVLPAATWYEKHDLNTTDMHPFVHSFNPAIARRGRPAPTGTPS